MARIAEVRPPTTPTPTPAPAFKGRFDDSPAQTLLLLLLLPLSISLSLYRSSVVGQLIVRLLRRLLCQIRWQTVIITH